MLNRMPNLANAEEIRFFIQEHCKKHRDVGMQARAFDPEWLDARVKATDAMMRRLIREGGRPLSAEVRALREVAYAD